MYMCAATLCFRLYGATRRMRGNFHSTKPVVSLNSSEATNRRGGISFSQLSFYSEIKLIK